MNTEARFQAIKAWAEKNIDLITLEYQEEIKQDRELRMFNTLEKLERDCHAIRNLIRMNERSDLGPNVLTLTLDASHREWLNLTRSRLVRGGIIGLTVDNSTEPIIDGNILDVQRFTLQIDCTKDDFQRTKEISSFNLIKVISSVTYRRMKFSLNKLIERCETQYLIGLLFDVFSIPEPENRLLPYRPWQTNLPFSTGGGHDHQIVWFNRRLNESQKEAIRFALYQQQLAVIYGPPGTGKTTTLTELILQLVFRNIKPILVCAPSNVAVDNIFKQLLKYYGDFCSTYRTRKCHEFVRLGNPVRVDPKIRPYCLEPNRNGRQSQYGDKQLKKKLRNASVILSTLSSATIDGKMKYLYDDLARFQFEIVIIDECGQAMEASAWIPLSYTKKCVLAGDPKQLPPTVRNQEALAEGLGVSLLERVYNQFQDRADQIIRVLNIQHRMNRVIMDWPSQYFYDGQLEAANQVANRRLILNGYQMPPIRLIDTIGLDMFELDGRPGSSRANMYEAKIVCIVVREFIENGLDPSKIGIISPYRLQTSLIEAGCRSLFPGDIYDRLEIDSVDAFQGGEKEAIIVSLVRSNPGKNIGFLGEERRLNVAITRARTHLTVVGDSGTVTERSDALRSFIEYCYEKDDCNIESASLYRSQMDQLPDIDIMVTSYVSMTRNHRGRTEFGRQRPRPNHGRNQQNQSSTQDGSNGQIIWNQAYQLFNRFRRNTNAAMVEFPTTLNARHRNQLKILCRQHRFTYEIQNVLESGETRKKLVIYRHRQI